MVHQGQTMNINDYTGAMHNAAYVKNILWHKAHFVLNMLFCLTISNPNLTC